MKKCYGECWECYEFLEDCYKKFFFEVELFVGDVEVQVFFCFEQDYWCDVFIEEFWKECDFYFDMVCNEFCEQWEECFLEVWQIFDLVEDVCVQYYFFNGFVDLCFLICFFCSVIQIEVWFYGFLLIVEVFDVVLCGCICCGQFVLFFYCCMGMGFWCVWFFGEFFVVFDQVSVDGGFGVGCWCDEFEVVQVIIVMFSQIGGLLLFNYECMLVKWFEFKELVLCEWVDIFEFYFMDFFDDVLVFVVELDVSFLGCKQS